ncbi:MAG: cyclic nucleotide-binding domain-containing protein [Spirochaetales bacterium]|nr:cyclic nucleotide-binding domain-containing protein [Spirochaetales bacterium]
METLQFKKGQIIVQENTPGSEMFVIQAGKVRVFKTINEEKVELAILGKEDFFGEMCLLLDHPRSATVEALEDTRLLRLTKESFRGSIKSRPEIAERIVSVLARRLLQANAIIARLEGEKRSLEIIYGGR